MKAQIIIISFIFFKIGFSQDYHEKNLSQKIYDIEVGLDKDALAYKIKSKQTYEVIFNGV